MMLSKKSLCAILLLFISVPLQAKHFLKYEKKSFEITLNGLKQSTMLNDLLEEHASDDEDDEDYDTFHDQEGNFIITLDPILKRVTLPTGQVVSPENVETFIKLSEESTKAKDLKTHELIIQLNLANVLDNQTILNNAALTLAEKIKKKSELLAFFEGKGFLVTVINMLPKDILKHVLKIKLLDDTEVPFKILRGHISSIKNIAWSPDGKQMASESDDGTVINWNPKTGKRKKKRRGQTYKFKVTVRSPDGKQVASGLHDGTIIIWDPKTGKRKKILRGHTSSISSIAWLPCGDLIASGSYDGRVIIWNPKTGKPEKILSRDTFSIVSVDWSPDGSLIASGAYNGTVIIWNPKTGKIEKILRGHTQPVTSVAWSPNGTRIASGSDNGTIIIWNPKTEKPEKILRGDTKPVSSIAWLSDGTRIATASYKTIIIWFLDLFDNIPFLQAATMLALQERAKETHETFNIETNEKIFEILTTLPSKKLESLQELGWIKISSKLLKKLKKHQEKSEQLSKKPKKQGKTSNLTLKDMGKIFKIYQLLDLLNTKAFTKKEKLFCIKQQIENLAKTINDPEAKKQAKKLVPEIKQAFFKALSIHQATHPQSPFNTKMGKTQK